MFRDRADAGRLLARLLEDRHPQSQVVLGLARGGVPVAFEVARRLTAAIDVFVVRKVGAPRQPEWAIGAVAEGGTVVRNAGSMHAIGLSEADFDRLVDRELAELRRRVDRYRGGRPLPALEDRNVVLVDDG